MSADFKNDVVAPRVCFCVVGWHFPVEFLSSIEKFLDVDIFIVSHQPRTPSLEKRLASNGQFHVLWEKNRGYDWGAFEQFRRSGKWRDYDYVFFIHDDVRILSRDLIPKTLDLLKKHYVVGNGRVLQTPMSPSIAAESYAHAIWKPPSPDFCHDAVRGSFFAVRKCVLELDDCFEVFWDRFHVTSNCGNWSTRASCAKWQYAFGDTCFGFLSNTPCQSEYLIEFVRGEEEGDEACHEQNRLREVFNQWIWNRGYVGLNKIYMKQYWGRSNCLSKIWMKVIGLLIHTVGG